MVSSNVLPLAAVGDFGALHCQPSTNVDRSNALDLTTSAPIAANGCACCTTQIYKYLHKNRIFCKFIHARKEKFYPTIICIG